MIDQRSPLDNAFSLEDTARIKKNEGDIQTALKCYNEALQIRKAFLDTNDLTIADVLIGMSQVYVLDKQLDMAVLMVKQASSIIDGLKIPGEYHKLAEMFHSIGNIYSLSKKYDLATDAYKKQLSLQKRTKGANVLILISAMLKMAQIHESKGDYERAVQLYKETLRIQKKVCKEDDASIYENMKCLAKVLCKKKDYPEAIEMFNQTMHLGKNHGGKEMAELMELTGMAHLKNANFHLAIKHFLKSKQMKISALGFNHKDVALIIYKIATAYLMKGDEEHAIYYYNYALKIQKNLYGNNHMDVSLTLKRLATAHRQRGNLCDALANFEEALRIEKKHLGDYDLLIAKTLNLIGNIHLQKAQVGKAKSAFADSSRILRRCGMRDDHLKIETLKFYELSVLHPEAAAVA